MKLFFSFFLSTVLATTSYTQIIYTDISDYTGTGLGKANLRDTFNLDLNNDASVDFKLIMWNPTFGTTPHYELKVSNTVSSSRVGISYDDAFIASMAHALNNGDSIHATLATWKSEAQASSFQIFLAYNGGTSQQGGEFLGAGDRYLPLKFNIGANAHYGWVRINVNATCTQYVVKDYAYNTTANQTIMAGQTVGVYDNTPLSRAFIRLEDRFIRVDGIEIIGENHPEISLYDTSGKLLMCSNKSTLDARHFPKGIYLVVVIYNNAVQTQKIYLL